MCDAFIYISVYFFGRTRKAIYIASISCRIRIYVFRRQALVLVVYFLLILLRNLCGGGREECLLIIRRLVVVEVLFNFNSSLVFPNKSWAGLIITANIQINLHTFFLRENQPTYYFCLVKFGISKRSPIDVFINSFF